MKTLLFPTDFSSTSLNAFRYALHLADKINAKIITLHVYDLPIAAYADNLDFLKKNYDVLDWDKFENGKSDVPTLRELAEAEHLGKIELSHMLKKGNVIDTIIDVAANESVDFIVMGTKGATGLREVFLGSVTEKVLSRASATVLAIPLGCVYRPIHKLLFLTQFKAYQMPILRRLHELAKILQASIDVLEITKRHEENETEIINKWKTEFPGLDMNFYILRSDDIEDTIIDFIDTNKIDIVAMPVHHKNFFKKLFAVSLSERLAFHCDVPIMGIYIIESI